VLMQRTIDEPRTVCHPGEREPARWESGLIELALFLMTLLVFRHILSGSFLNWDDLTLVANNERLTHPTLKGLSLFWTEYDTGFLALYTPMAYSVWWCLAWSFGLKSAVPFHATNLLLHACNVVLVFMLLQRLLGRCFTGSRMLIGATLGACLYALHPMQAEPVCWISGFNNVIAATFGLYALVRLCDALQAQNRWRAGTWYLFATLGLLLAFCSKPTALVIPLVAAILCILVLGESIRRTIRWLAPWCVLMVPFVWIGQKVQDASYMTFPLYQRLVVVADTVSFYTSKVLIPYHISADYGRTPDFVLDRCTSQPLWPLALLLIAVSIYVWRRFRWLGAALAISVVAIAPTSGIIPFFFQSYSTVANRYFYVAMLGPALLLGAVVCLHQTRKAIAAWTFGLALLGAMTVHATIAWQGTYFWAEDMLQGNPHSLVGNLCMAGTLAHDRYFEQARPYFDEARKSNPAHPRLLLGLGMFYLETKQPGEALTCLMFLLKQNPHYREAYPVIAAAAALNGTPQLGVMALEGVVAVRPNDADVQAYLGSLYGYMARYDLAYAHLSRALELDPTHERALQFMAKLQSEMQGKGARSHADVTHAKP